MGDPYRVIFSAPSMSESRTVLGRMTAMTLAHPVLTGAECFRHDVYMPDWERLGTYVVARRVELGHKQRTEFAAAAQLGVRVLSDIENGRRSNFDAVTIAALEKALGWETGSVTRVANGGEPHLRDHPPRATEGELRRLVLGYQPDEDEALVRVMRSNLPDSKKRQLVRLLIAEREAAERARVERAEQLIRLVGDEAP